MQMIIKQNAAVVVMQRFVRVKYWRKRRLDAVLVLQKWIRRVVRRVNTNRRYLAAIVIQSWIRRCGERARRDRVYRAVVLIQRWMRGVKARVVEKERIGKIAVEEVLSEDDEEMVLFRVGLIFLGCRKGPRISQRKRTGQRT